MKVTKKAHAKVNLCLNVFLKNEQGFHDLESLVVTVDLYDKITLTSRKDSKVTLKVTGTNRDYIYNHIPQKDNAYKAVLAYMQEYGTTGADILLQKNIPSSSGMGGSSTCASTALLCMEEIYKKGANLPALANSLGSDTNYLLKGGWAILKGRGDKVEYLKVDKKLQLVAIFPEGGVDTTACFKKFDEMNLAGESAVNSDIGALINSLSEEEIAFSECKNALQAPACEINGEVKRAIDFAHTLSPRAVFMTGSGSTVCMLFDYEGLNRWALEKCKQAGFNAELLTTVTPK